jgi:hypothetical protein
VGKGKTNDSGAKWIAAYIIASPLLMLVLGIAGIAVFGAFVLALTDIYLIIFSLVGTAIIAALSRKSLRKAIPAFAVIAGFLYWIANINLFIRSNGILNFFCNIPIIGQGTCGAGALLTLPALIADILVILFYSSILGVIAAKV